MSTLLFNHSFAQKAKPLAAKSLAYEWKIDHVAGKVYTTLRLINQTGEAINMANWGIYLNSIKTPKLKIDATSMYEIKHINGDLHYIYPGKNFKSLPAGKAHEIEILTPDIRNYTELPSGFYLVWNEQPGTAYPLINLSKKSDTTELAISKATFLNNRKIKEVKEEQMAKIFPTPVKYEEVKGLFEINSLTKIITDHSFAGEAALLQQDFATLLSAPLTIKKDDIAIQKASGENSLLKNCITLIKNPALGKAYALNITKDHILISSGDPSGIFYGIQSLKTLISPKFYAAASVAKQTKITVQAVNVLDSARFSHRSLLIDVARNFLPKKELLKTLDLMALYKINVLHLHLNDDEGWRIEIPGLPELTGIGAKRGYASNNKGMLPPSYGSGPDVGNAAGSGYYSTGDFKEILLYATARHIKVIPEIETPGHARAAIKSMDARYEKFMALGETEKANQYLLRDPEDKSVYRSVQGWNDNVINIAMPSVYQFLEKVTGEIANLYHQANAPLETIHMGGDEVPAGVWSNSPMVRKLQQTDPSLKNVDDLWRYYFKKINAILNAQQLYLYGWEEIDLKHINVAGRKKLVPDSLLNGLNYQVDVWNNIIGTGAEDLAYRLANSGFKVILSNVTNMYLDMAYNQSFYEHGMNWAGFVDTDKPFSFIPYDYYKSITENEYGEPVSQEFFKGKDILKDEARKNIAGLQVALWSETITDTLTFEYMLLPKLLGFAERAWAQHPEWASIQTNTVNSESYNNAWSAFVSLAGKRELPRLDYYHNGYAYRIPAPGVLLLNGKIEANVQFPGMIIKYTTDGSAPGINSKTYMKPITEKGTISLKVFTTKGNSGKTVVAVQ